MAKIILTLDNTYLSEYPLIKARTSIGRRPNNEVHLDNLAVSGEHAAIVKMGGDYFVEDLESTNGTLVNGEAIKKHLLQHDDVIELGKYRLKYVNDAIDSAAVNNLSNGFEKTMMVNPSAIRSSKKRAAESDVVSAVAGQSNSESLAIKRAAVDTTSVAAPTFSVSSQSDMVGRVQVLNGSSSGRELVLNKALTTLGKTGVQVAVITKRPNGYFITHVEGKVLPIVNGVSAGAQAVALSDHDVIELAGIKMEFYLTRV